MTEKVSGSKALELMARELKNVRIKKELTLEDVGQLIKIKKNYLEKIEAGDFSFLPRVYIFTYMKEYAQEMGIHNEETLEQCRRELQIYSPAQTTVSIDGGKGRSALRRDVYEIIKSIRFPPVRIMVKIGIVLFVFVVLAILYFFKRLF